MSGQPGGLDPSYQAHSGSNDDSQAPERSVDSRPSTCHLSLEWWNIFNAYQDVTLAVRPDPDSWEAERESNELRVPFDEESWITWRATPPGGDQTQVSLEEMEKQKARMTELVRKSLESRKSRKSVSYTSRRSEVEASNEARSVRRQQYADSVEERVDGSVPETQGQSDRSISQRAAPQEGLHSPLAPASAAGSHLKPDDREQEERIA